MDKRYVIVGAGHRCLHMFGEYLAGGKAPGHVLTGVYDVSLKRSNYFKRRLEGDFKVYGDFDDMLRRENPHCVIVTSVDSTHDYYIVKALDHGCDVICEKPIATTLEKCKSIVEAKRRNPDRKLTVTFNLRYTVFLNKIRSLIRQDRIGKVLSVNYEYLLNKSHGADYFRRWHRNSANTGGMLVHKSTHHFDVVNWWLGDEPATVTAQGDLVYFGKNGKKRGEMCRGCPHCADCEFFLDLKGNALFKGMYLDAEGDGDYIRDRCVFGEGIDINDNMGVVVRYKGGAILTYSLTMFNEYEGYRVSVVGDKGRIEAAEYYSGLMASENVYKINVFSNGEVETIVFGKEDGAHGGGDNRLLSDLFGQTSAEDHRRAGLYDAVKSAAIGICAEQSIKEGKAIDLQHILREMKI